ncbi:hypothetical protein TDB9533_01977 [Thalassocella blandensis]|nr:hypothetical protein TDB9533_01977 [Thalassocella blandensis]
MKLSGPSSTSNRKDFQKGEKNTSASPHSSRAKPRHSELKCRSELKGTEKSITPALQQTKNQPPVRAKTMYEHMEFKSKRGEFRRWLNPFKPQSDITIPKQMEPPVNTRTGRVLGGLTGEQTKHQVQQSLESFSQFMRPGDKFTLEDKKNAMVEAGFSASLADIAAPGIGMSGVTLGPKAGGGISYAHGVTDTLAMSKSKQDHVQLKGKHNITDEVTLKGSGGVGIGMDVGPLNMGPSLSLNTEVGIKKETTHTATLSPQMEPANEITSFAQNTEALNLNAPQWEQLKQEKQWTIPAQASVDAGLEISPKTDSDISQSGSGSIGAGIGVEDLKHPKSTASVFVSGAGGINTSVGVGTKGNIEGSVEQDIDVLEAYQLSKQSTLHGSHYNHVFSRHKHVEQLDKMIGPGSSKLAIEEFHKEFGNNIPRRNMEFIPSYLEDGRMRVDGHLNVKAAEGHILKTPVFTISNTTHANLDQTRLLFETAEVVDKKSK